MLSTLRTMACVSVLFAIHQGGYLQVDKVSINNNSGFSGQGNLILLQFGTLLLELNIPD